MNVEHGKARCTATARDGEEDVKVDAIDAASINVGASQAIVAARAFGEKKGTVPKNVLVGGVFAELPGRRRGRLHAGHLDGRIRQRHGPRRRADIRGQYDDR